MRLVNRGRTQQRAPDGDADARGTTTLPQEVEASQHRQQVQPALAHERDGVQHDGTDKRGDVDNRAALPTVMIAAAAKILGA